jgi:glycosyltransferase involved in cell wall biosynthesis
LIVRDVQSVLDRCLTSISDVCDEICIVDTGSTDSTAEMASARADRFDAFDGCNDRSGRIADFATARNHCLDLATGQWILSIDADEVFANRGEHTVHDVLEATTASGVAVKMARGESEWLAIRLFRNMSAQRFRNRVHETVRVVGEVVTVEDFTILDLGQQKKPEISAERNVRICKAILAEDRSDLRATFYLAEGLRKLGRYEEAGQFYMDCLCDSRLSDVYRWAALESLGVCFFCLARFRLALDSASLAARLRPDMAESFCLMGDVYLALHDIAAAKASYNMAASRPYPPHGFAVFVRKDAYGEYPLRQLTSLRGICDKNGIDYDLL